MKFQYIWKTPEPALNENGFVELNRLLLISSYFSFFLWLKPKLSSFFYFWDLSLKHNTMSFDALDVSRWERKKRLNNRYGTLGMRKLFVFFFPRAFNQWTCCLLFIAYIFEGHDHHHGWHCRATTERPEKHSKP